jgi:hypothetical protein
MENTDILKSLIEEKIVELNKIENRFLYAPPKIVGSDQNDMISKKIKSLSKLYQWMYFPLSCFMVSAVLITCFVQIFYNELFSWNFGTSLVILLTLGILTFTCGLKQQMERLKLRQFLIELKNEVK